MNLFKSISFAAKHDFQLSKYATIYQDYWRYPALVWSGQKR